MALIFCFETLLFFSLLAAMLAAARPSYKGAGRVVIEVARKILLYPIVAATALCVASAALRVGAPVALDRLQAFLQNRSTRARGSRSA